MILETFGASISATFVSENRQRPNATEAERESSYSAMSTYEQVHGTGETQAMV